MVALSRRIAPFVAFLLLAGCAAKETPPGTTTADAGSTDGGSLDAGSTDAGSADGGNTTDGGETFDSSYYLWDKDSGFRVSEFLWDDANWTFIADDFTVPRPIPGDRKVRKGHALVERQVAGNEPVHRIEFEQSVIQESPEVTSRQLIAKDTVTGLTRRFYLLEEYQAFGVAVDNEDGTQEVESARFNMHADNVWEFNGEFLDDKPETALTEADKLTFYQETPPELLILVHAMIQNEPEETRDSPNVCQTFSCGCCCSKDTKACCNPGFKTASSHALGSGEDISTSYTEVQGVRAMARAAAERKVRQLVP